jgi:uncharacterized protein (DUF2235 family)
MAKNIVIFSDGTGQDGGVRPDQRLSNVYKLYRATRIGPDSKIDPAQQIAFYDAGLGTEGDAHGWLKFRRTIVKLLASVMGRGIGRNIADCYEFIINHWRPGDRIFIIGFSRGAYTARCVAQVLALCGVPQHASNTPGVPFRRFSRAARSVAERAVHRVYEHGAGHPRAKFEAERDELARRFRIEFGAGDVDAPNAHPHFIGAFDTVAALGASGFKYYGILAGFLVAGAMLLASFLGLLSLVWVFPFWTVFGVALAISALAVWAKVDADSERSISDFPAGAKRKFHKIKWRADNYDRGLSGHVGYARHACAIDEDRKDFPRVPWGRNGVIRPQRPDEPPPLVQLFFAGNHSDIGGSYPEEESRLSDIALAWMTDEATSIPGPLIVDRSRLELWPDAGAMQHSEVESLKEKLSWVPKWAPKWLREGWGRKVREPAGYPVHPTVFERFAGSTRVQGGSADAYKPEGLFEDARFSAFFTEAGPARPDFSNTVFTLEAASSATGTLPELKDYLALAVAKSSRREGAVIVLPSNPIEKNDPYRDELALKHLDELIRRCGCSGMAVRLASPVDPTETLVGRFVPGISEDAALLVTASVGQFTAILIDEEGTAMQLPSISPGALDANT